MNKMKKPMFFSAHDQDSREAERLLRESKIDFIEILANDVDEPTLVVRSSAYSFKGLQEIKEYIQLHI
jgi:hypothetical protein